MYVKPATTPTEVNLTAFEMDGQIYYISCKRITFNQELKVAYSPPYAAKYGLTAISPGNILYQSFYSFLKNFISHLEQLSAYSQVNKQT